MSAVTVRLPDDTPYLTHADNRSSSAFDIAELAHRFAAPFGVDVAVDVNSAGRSGSKHNTASVRFSGERAADATRGFRSFLTTDAAGINLGSGALGEKHDSAYIAPSHQEALADSNNLPVQFNLDVLYRADPTAMKTAQDAAHFFASAAAEVKSPTSASRAV